MLDGYKKLKEEIRQLRKHLDELMEKGASADQIYEASVALDEKVLAFTKLENANRKASND